MQPDNGRLRVVDPSESPELGDGSTRVADASEEILDAPSPGRYIREQRQRRGMSLEQLSAATKIPRASLELLESDRFGELPGPVFVKGFLRCTARALGMDPGSVMDLLYERERAALNARRRDKPTPVEAPPEPAPTKKRPPAVRRNDAPGFDRTPLQQLVAYLPTPAMLLWIIVAALVAMMVLGAFNLMGTTGTGPTT